jgi:hypothetical protein
MMRILFVLSLFLCAAGTNAQSLLWTKTYGSPGGDGAQAMVVTPEGEVVMTGFTSISGNQEVLMMKTNSEGDVLWNKSFSSTLDNGRGMGTTARDMKQTYDGGFIITGRTIDQVAFLIKTDRDGNIEWEDTYHYPVGADDRGHEVYQTADSGYIVAGQTWIVNGPFGSYDFLLFKTNKNGEVEWMKVYAFTDYGNDVALGVSQLPDGGYIMGGFTQSTSWASFVIRTDSQGNEVWRNIYEGPWQSECYDIEPTPDGGFIMTGLHSDFDTDTDVMLTKLDGSGNIIWEKIYISPGGQIAEQGESIQQLSDGYLIGGMTSTEATSWNMYVIRTNLNGDTLWTQIIGGEMDDRGFAAAKAPDGSIYSAGWTWSSGQGAGDIYLAKLSDKTTGIINNNTTVSGYELSQNYPNPFNPETKINFSIPSASIVKLRVYDISGKQVAELVNSSLQRGSYTYSFNGAGLPSGAYFYMLEAAGFKETKKMLLVK